jgi:hypothetical protein
MELEISTLQKTAQNWRDSNHAIRRNRPGMAGDRIRLEK